MNRIIKLLIKGIKDPRKVINFTNRKFRITESAKVGERGEKLEVKNWQTAKKSKDLVTLAHIQRYEWVAPFVKNLYCLDAGCGSGYGTYYLADSGAKKIVGIDNFDKAINYAKKYYKRENLEYTVMDVRNLEFRDNIFDALISFDVLEHLKEMDQEKFLSEIKRVIRPNGILFIGCPNKKLSQGANPYHLRGLTKAEFEQILREHFKNVKLLGQDVQINGIRQKENFINICPLSYQNFIIVKDECELACGLLAICKNPIRKYFLEKLNGSR